MNHSRSDTEKWILGCGLIPVIRAESRVEALEIAGVLVEAGVPVLEITYTVPGALACMEAICDQYGDRVRVGAGTVLDRESCRLAILAGARFIVSPHLDPEIIATAHRYDCLAMPGALTPTEVVRAMEAGADIIKIFPCDAVGGPKYLQALKAPLPQARLAPTGGVTPATAAAYLQAGAAALGVGSGLLSEAQRRARDWDGVRRNAQALLEMVRAHQQ